MTIREMWLRMTATRYTRRLEAEVARQGAEIVRQGAEIARLRGENRALLNSILGIAGIPPIPVDLPDVAPSRGAASSAPTNVMNVGAAPDGRATAQAGHSGAVPLRNEGGLAAEDIEVDASGAQAPHGATGEGARRKPRPDAITPMRRRSWQQITRMLEFESARKTVASD
ncbi:MAG: hypothetical protein LAN59_02305 [Acidobacteriia bacterium]|nr:hypothetical protein [Terriglobia bacterium]